MLCKRKVRKRVSGEVATLYIDHIDGKLRDKLDGHWRNDKHLNTYSTLVSNETTEKIIKH